MKLENEMFEQLKKASNLKMDSNKQNEIWHNIDREMNIGLANPTWKRRFNPFAFRTVAAAMVAVVAIGIGTHWYLRSSPTSSTIRSSVPSISQGAFNHGTSYSNQSVYNSTTSGVSSGGVTWTIPAEVTWNGHSYRTKGYIHGVGSQLGVASYPDPSKIFSIPGQNSNNEIAVEVDTPNSKYILAVRQQQGWILNYSISEKPSYYIITVEPVKKVGRQFGVYTKIPSQGTSGFLSNSLPDRTRFFLIPGVSWEKAFAVQTNTGYVKAVYFGEEPPKIN